MPSWNAPDPRDRMPYVRVRRRTYGISADDGPTRGTTNPLVAASAAESSAPRPSQMRGLREGVLAEPSAPRPSQIRGSDKVTPVTVAKVLTMIEEVQVAETQFADADAQKFAADQASCSRVCMCFSSPSEVEFNAARDALTRAQAALAVVTPRQLREVAALDGCVAGDIEAARNTHTPKVALVELIAANQLRKRAAQQGCLADEIEAAWRRGSRNAWTSQSGAMNELISRYTSWRTRELPQQLAETGVADLVKLAQRTRSIGHDALEDARDDEAPAQALVRLLLGAPDFVAEQRQEARRILVQYQLRCLHCDQPMPRHYSGSGDSDRVCPAPERHGSTLGCYCESDWELPWLSFGGLGGRRPAADLPFFHVR